MIDHDLVVVGGGPGGYAAALYGASCGLDVGLVEKDKLGGTCLNVGCIPAKELLESASVFRTVRSAGEFGIGVGGAGESNSREGAMPALDMGVLLARKQNIVSGLSKGLTGSLKDRGISLYSAVGSLTAPGRVTISNIGSSKKTEELAAKTIVLAGGSTPRQLPGLEPDGIRIVTSDHILSDDPENTFWERGVPSSVAIVGGGAIGVEFASFFADVGSKVALVEALDEILPGVDKDLVRVLKKSFTKRGIQISTSARVTDYDTETATLKFTSNSGDKSEDSEFNAEVVVICIGRRPFADLLGLGNIDVGENIGELIDSAGFVNVDENLQTPLPGVYAVGDLIDTPQLAHTGFSEGVFVVCHSLGEEPSLLDYEKTPWAIYCHPEVAFVGLSEEEAKAQGYEVKVSKQNFSANGRAQIMGETEGLIKVVAEAESGKLLGVHLIGPWVTEQLGAGYLAVNWEAGVDDVAELIFPHPTLSETFSEAALALTGRALHG